MTKELCETYPNYTFIIISTKSPKYIQIKKAKFMIPNETTIGQFMIQMRGTTFVKIDPNQSIVALINNRMPKMTDCVCELRDKYNDENGILHIDIETESVFG